MQCLEDSTYVRQFFPSVPAVPTDYIRRKKPLAQIDDAEHGFPLFEWQDC
jgi:hypothetical protein